MITATETTTTAVTTTSQFAVTFAKINARFGGRVKKFGQTSF